MDLNKEYEFHRKMGYAPRVLPFKKFCVERLALRDIQARLDAISPRSGEYARLEAKEMALCVRLGI